MRVPNEVPRRMPRVTRRMRFGLLIAGVVLIVLIISLRGLASFWTDYLWFQSVGFTSVFRGVLLTRVLLGAAFILLFFVLMAGNLYVADRWAPETIDPGQINDLVVRYREVVFPRSRLVRIVTAIIFALLAGWGANREWNNWDLFRYHLSFPGATDAEFHKNVGFYVFQLPFIEFLIGWAFEAVIVVLIVTAVFHYLNGSITPQSRVRRSSPAAKVHLSVLLAALAVIKAVDYYFERYELVLSRSHVVNGATATSVHADKPALTLLVFIAVIAALLFLANIRQRGWLLPTVAVALWALVQIVVGGIYPALYQSIRVSPSEQTREAPYITDNILATRTAYGLNNVKVESSYNYAPTIDPSQIQGSNAQEVANQQTLANVRLLDPAVNLINTFNKYQALRQYYSFNDLDLDRYTLSLNGQPPQTTATITSIRELNTSIPSGFVNQRLVYTHGYGAVVAPISQNGVNPDGTPNFSLSQLPPIGQPALDENGSEIYYGIGQETSGYVIADSKTQELDYEANNGNQIYNSYAGSGGVKAGSLIRRAAFALRFGDFNFLLSGQITPSSRVIYVRNIVARAQKAAPFLKFDGDPYAVVVNNQVYWIIDAYTTTDNYPYSQNANTDRVPPNSGLNTTFNYVRNSVKVVISAYDGSMKFYDMNTNDPILKVYERAFPDLFTNVSQAPAAIVAHFRYPEDLFAVQTNMYGRYRLTTVQPFYTQAQAWAVSPDPGSGPLSDTELGATTAAPTAPGVLAPTVNRLAGEYIEAHLPGLTQQTFMLITPFVPQASTAASQNLTGFMTASSDPWDYGDLTLFALPPGETVDGPGLISNVIRSNTNITEALTLLDQKGSIVELGEVSILPLDQTLLYVEPVYVESSSNQIPELRDVVVVYNNVAYQSGNASLDAALCQITNSPSPVKPFARYCATPAATSTVPSTQTTPTNATVPSLISQALADSNAAQTALQHGNLGAYQADNAAANKLLDQANAALAKAPTKG